MENLASDSFGEIEILIPSQVEKIRSILESEHNFVVPKHCDEFLVRCLRLKDGNLENAIKIVRAFHTTIANLRHWDVVLSPSIGTELYDTGVAEGMKKRDVSGRCVLIIRAGLWQPEKIGFKQAVAFLWMMMQYAQAHLQEIQRLGLVIVWDWENFTMRHLSMVNHSLLMTLMKWAQNGVLGRINAIHSLRHPRVVGVIYKAMKPFLKEKIKRRIIFHDSTDSLVKHMGAHHLPNFVGGNLDPEECFDKNLVQSFLGSDEYFKDMFEIGFPNK